MCGVLISTECRAESKPPLGQQFIEGHNAVSFSILVPYTEGEKRVENVKVTCDEGKCRVRVESISRRACGGGTTNELIQINDYGPEEKNEMFRPKVTSGDDEMLIVQFIDAGQEARLRVLLRWEQSVGGRPFIASGGVVGEEEIAFSQPTRSAPISEIVGAPIVCHARFQSR
jgi:hypothetical protein